MIIFGGNVNVKTSDLILKGTNNIIFNPNYYGPTKDTDENIIEYYMDYELDQEIIDRIDYDQIKDGWRPQGYTITDDEIIISAHKNGKKFSRLYVYDKTTGKYKGYITTNLDSHVGGIDYDPVNKILFITGNNGEVWAYDYKQIKTAIGDWDSERKSKELLNDKQFKEFNSQCFSCIGEFGNAATICYYDGKLYVATFRGSFYGKLKVFDINVSRNEANELEIKYTEYDERNCPSQTQGIAVTDYKGERYIFYATSLGKKQNQCIIRTYKINEDRSQEYLGFHYCQTSVEGIKIDDNILRGVNENGPKTTIYYTLDELLTDYEKYNIEDFKYTITCYLNGIDYDCKNDYIEVISDIIEELSIFSPEAKDFIQNNLYNEYVLILLSNASIQANLIIEAKTVQKEANGWFDNWKEGCREISSWWSSLW